MGGISQITYCVQMTAETYIDSFMVHMELLFKKSDAFRKNMIFIHDNALSQSVNKTNEYMNNWNFVDTVRILFCILCIFMFHMNKHKRSQN